MVITMAKLRMAHASTHGARKPHTSRLGQKRLNDGDNNGQATHGAHKPPGPIFRKFNVKLNLNENKSVLLVQLRKLN